MPPYCSPRIHPILIDSQRAGDYVLAWSEELDKQYSKTFGGPETATLVKRGAKEPTGGAEGPPAKKMKVEGGTSDIDDEVRRRYEKGEVSKVRRCSVCIDTR